MGMVQTNIYQETRIAFSDSPKKEPTICGSYMLPDFGAAFLNNSGTLAILNLEASLVFAWAMF